MRKLLGYGLVILGVAWIALLDWVAASESPKPLLDWPAKAWAILSVGAAVAALGAWVGRRKGVVARQAI